jgi:S-adenosylmethionine:tRNA-ribosyltransferase-isomerase (queuine synthetase)
MYRTSTDRKYEAARHRQMTEEVLQKNNIPSVDLKFCDYDKNRKVLKLVSEYIGMPLTFYVKSHHTGKEVRFVPVTPADTLFDEDGWDGEQQIYRPVGNVPGVDYMVIYHAW